MSKPIDIPKNEKNTEVKSSSIFSGWLSYKQTETEKKELNTCDESKDSDKGIFAMSSETETETENETENETDDEVVHEEWQEQPRKTCCSRLNKKFIKHTGFNTTEFMKDYEIAVDKANKDFDKFWEKCTTENFNLYTDALLRNFAKNLHWVIFGAWFHSIQDPKKVFVPIYVSDCGHVCAEI